MAERPEQDGAESVVLPAETRQRVVALAAEQLSRLPADQVPPSLRPFARFTARRARLAAGALAACLESDAVFRRRVGEAARAAMPGLADALDAGSAVPAAPPEDVAAVAYLIRPPGWRDHVDRAAGQLAAQASAAADAAGVDAVQRLTEQLEAVRAGARAQAEQARADVGAARDDAAASRQEVAALRRTVRSLGDRAARAERAASRPDPAPAAPPEPEPRSDDAEAVSPAEVRRLRARLAAAEAALAAARTAGREDRHSSEVRLRVLLDAVLGAAAGLRRELALPPLQDRPADAVAAQHVVDAVPPATPLQGRADDDPALLDALLGAPSVHLLVDGYNVTKTGYGEQTLEAQRGRLLSGLAGLAARTGAEVTVVFDGVDRVTPLAVPSPRGVRLLFSRTGESADDVLRALVRAEPPGRPLVVVTSDRAVADDARADGARPVPSRALLRLLER